MNEEIKKILDYLKDENDYIELHGVKYKKLYMNNLIIDDNEVSVLLDYITNLQEENERLNHVIKVMENNHDKIISMIDYGESIRQDFENGMNYGDYKQRIDKAIEYIKTCNPDVDLNSMFLNESYISNYGANELLKILGGDE